MQSSSARVGFKLFKTDFRTNTKPPRKGSEINMETFKKYVYV